MNFAEKTSKRQHDGVVFADATAASKRDMSRAVMLIDRNRESLVPVGTDAIANKLKSLDQAGIQIDQYFVGPDERGNYYLDFNRPTSKATEGPETVAESFWAKAAKAVVKHGKKAQADAQRDGERKRKENERERERLKRTAAKDMDQQRRKHESVDDINEAAEEVLRRYGDFF